MIEIAVEKGIYKGKTKFNFDNYISASKIINELKNILISDKIAKQLLELIKFRNYLVHAHYLNDNKEKIESKFPDFLFMIYEANDYISNVTNRIIGGQHIFQIYLKLK